MSASTKETRILLPLTKQFAVMLSFFALCTAGVLLYSIYDFTKLQNDLWNASLEPYSSQLAKNTMNAYENYEHICYSIAYNQQVQNYLMSRENGKSYEGYLQIENQLNSAALLNSDITDIAVYGSDGHFAALNGSSDNYEEFARTLSESRFSYRSAGTAVINGTDCHVLAMPIYSLGTGTSRYLGLLFLAIDVDSLFNTASSSTGTTYDPEIIFLNEDNRLVYGKVDLYEALVDVDAGKGLLQVNNIEDSVVYAAKKYTIPVIDHTLYVLIDKSHTQKQVIQLFTRLLICMGALLVLILLFLFLLYRPLIRSLQLLTRFMKTLSSGDRRAYKEKFTIHQGPVGISEIDEICKAFNEMLQQTDMLNHTIFDTYLKMYEMENNNRLTEIAFLRSQVNPHFLYNTLTMICGMAAEGMTDEIISVTGALSRIFRYSIKGSDMVTLQEEMDIVRAYLMIQKERFGERFTVQYDFWDNSLSCLIPKMIVQPLVENAIVHGLEKSLKPGQLRIGAGRNPEHGYLAIWIYDTGVGMPEDKLKELRDALSHLPGKKQGGNGAAYSEMQQIIAHEGIGILNVNSRMVLYYGTDYTLLIDSEEGVGTNIQIRVPYRTRKEEN
ncbi:MAG: sensor histidine kinase [Lachnospiraceae bacterium]|nr:sensor histidine kinase [Lachnospiraceae bacterium]